MKSLSDIEETHVQKTETHVQKTDKQAHVQKTEGETHVQKTDEETHVQKTDEQTHVQKTEEETNVPKTEGERSASQPVEENSVNKAAAENIVMKSAEEATEEFTEESSDQKLVEAQAEKSVGESNNAVGETTVQQGQETEQETSVQEAEQETNLQGPTQETTELTATDKVETDPRLSTSPPCEVSSTTVITGSGHKKTKIVEGVIADSNDEKVIIEDDEIDDVEPMETDTVDDSKVNELSDNLITPQTEEKRTECEEIDDVEPSTESADIVDQGSQTAIDPASLLASGVSISVIDKKLLTAAPTTADDEDEVEELDAYGDISVSVKNKAPEKSEESVPSAAVERKRSSTTQERNDEQEPMLTISKVVSLREGKESVPAPARTSSEDGRRSLTSSPSIQAHNNHPQSYIPRFPGYRGAPPMGPRGHLIPMMGPNQGMMMRGQFRGPPHGPRGPGPLPSLQARPAGPLSLPPSLPSAAGPVAEQLNKVAAKLAESLRRSLQDTFSDLEQKGNPESTIKALQLECEKQQWRHQQEIAEMKHNADLVIMEMRGTMEQEKQKALLDCRKQAEQEKLRAVLDTKKKQWCAACGKEAIFYCCWNTSYCDYPCQQAHWPSHMATCSQNGDGAEEEMNGVQHEPIRHHHHHQQQQQHLHQQQQQHYMQQLAPGRHPPRGPMHMRIPGDMAHMRFGMRPTLPGQMSFTRPYYM